MTDTERIAQLEKALVETDEVLERADRRFQGLDNTIKSQKRQLARADFELSVVMLLGEQLAGHCERLQIGIIKQWWRHRND